MSTAFQVDAGDIIASVALAIALYSAWKTDRFNKRQIAFEETSNRLNQLLIEREASENESAKRADISANFYKSGKHNYRLKVFNRGRGTATNIRFTTMDDSNLFIEGDISAKFPVPIMEQHQSVELIAAVCIGSQNRVHIKLLWDDETGQGREKELHPTW